MKNECGYVSITETCTDFAKLIQKHLREQTPLSETSTRGESFTSASSSVLSSGQGMGIRIYTKLCFISILLVSVLCRECTSTSSPTPAKFCCIQGKECALVHFLTHCTHNSDISWRQGEQSVPGHPQPLETSSSSSHCHHYHQPLTW